ncbi:hypothetical protein FZ983_24035 [Azospirillum sp. B21]|uniref:hypothetical protein n=1 Tax=Azospirillum sp. B21 TaxID=2607496 RepID=UPI0011ED2AA4|nr:hypothetical protein [Azospirillum sp. B21]KAA0576144.1 hypothetical protein FZ983_24035 [Azospirillum sp. B21]
MPIRTAMTFAITLALVTAVGLGSAAAQTAMPMDHAARHADAPVSPPSAVPTMGGHEAFGTIQEIVRWTCPEKVESLHLWSEGPGGLAWVTGIGVS